MSPLRVAQLSDTHFLAPGDTPEGGFAYDTNEAFTAVAAELAELKLDLVTVTGDVCDHGEIAQYANAGDSLASLGLPVNACPGNHDQDVNFQAALARPNVATSRVMALGEWCFIFADSNAIDPDTYEDRLHGNGQLGAAEASWIKAIHDATPAEHIFVWIHHPPAPTSALSYDADYEAEWRELVPQLPKLRGIGAGHTHVPRDWVFEGVPVFVAPSLKNNWDLVAKTSLPPGARTYEFADDGSITSGVVLADGPAYPRAPLGRAVMSLFSGELTYAEFYEIAARKQAERSPDSGG